MQVFVFDFFFLNMSLVLKLCFELFYLKNVDEIQIY